MGMLEKKTEKQQKKKSQKADFRDWVKWQIEEGKAQAMMYDIVESIRITSSEDWIMIIGRETKAFVWADSDVGKAFWNEVQKFDGKAKALKIIPAPGKLGFDIEIHESEEGFWLQENEIVSFLKEQPEEKKQFSLSWEAMQASSQTQAASPPISAPAAGMAEHTQPDAAGTGNTNGSAPSARKSSQRRLEASQTIEN